MKKQFLYLVLLPFMASSCTLFYKYSARITNLDTNDNALKMAFQFDERKPQRIKILNEADSVLLDVSAKKSFQMFFYPHSFDSMDIVYPTKYTLPILAKDKTYHFFFNGTTSWTYQPFYATKEGRWLFDAIGNQKNFKANYERWVGKDIISIEMPDAIKADAMTFLVKDAEGNLVSQMIKTKRNPSKKFALTLEKDQPTGKILTILIKSQTGIFTENNMMYDKYFIKVPDKSMIGIVGKYNGL